MFRVKNAVEGNSYPPITNYEIILGKFCVGKRMISLMLKLGKGNIFSSQTEVGEV